jgi:hypothetical protein
MNSADPKSCSTCPGWRLPALLVLVLAAIVLVQILGGELQETTTDVENAEQQAANVAAQQRVSLAIDFGNGQRRDFEIPWHEGLTVADAIQAAPGLKSAKRGSGNGAFLTAIGDIANQGADGNNWTYEVNGQTADRSFAIYELLPGDRVLWKFGPRP